VSVARKLVDVAREFRSPRGSRADALVRLADRGLAAAGLSAHASVARCAVVELTKPPARRRGLADLVVRRATRGDLEHLCAVDATDPALVLARFERGDLAYLGLLDDYVLCHTWFHRGPTPFDEDRATFASWALDASTFWSYHGVARPEARSSGVFVKLFQAALRETFEVHGGARVRGFIHRSNAASLAMHAHLGFAVVEDVTAVGAGGVKWVRWERGGRVRHWIVGRKGDLALPPGAG
jgi:hypothetical protein